MFRDGETVTLESDSQRLQVMPLLGGSATAWDWKIGSEWSPLFRRWNGMSDDRYTFAYYPLVPWSNRITRGGFEQDGIFYPIRKNRRDEPYPIHGDGWVQAWQMAKHTEDMLRLELESHHFNGNPHHYASRETFTLLPQGLRIELIVMHLAERPLPYGLGVHPFFVRNERTRLQSKMNGVWLSGANSIPVAHTPKLPPTWDYNTPASLEGPLVDNCFTGWDGRSIISYPDRGLTVTMTMADCNGYLLLYRQPCRPYFALEPITHPIDAFHMQNRPGLVVLSQGQSLNLKVDLFVERS
jgi:aldose 1-epimerase